MAQSSTVSCMVRTAPAKEGRIGFGGIPGRSVVPILILLVVLATDIWVYWESGLVFRWRTRDCRIRDVPDGESKVVVRCLPRGVDPGIPAAPRSEDPILIACPMTPGWCRALHAPACAGLEARNAVFGSYGRPCTARQTARRGDNPRSSHRLPGCSSLFPTFTLGGSTHCRSTARDHLGVIPDCKSRWPGGGSTHARIPTTLRRCRQ